MKAQKLLLGSILVVGVIATVICVGMVTGFSVMKPFISVDPVSDKYIGDQFTITGKTSLPAGTEILVEVYPASYEDQTGTGSGDFTGAMGTITIAGSTGSSNTWSFPIDTATFQPVEYLVTTSSLKVTHRKEIIPKGISLAQQNSRSTRHPGQSSLPVQRTFQITLPRVVSSSMPYGTLPREILLSFPGGPT